ncbi:MAG: Gfo/Idh/MocA family oxidoreductase [Ilumatobacter sp.]|nr:Gfo/Idh/MocA family oxidoreductase [Ilumatobacter sp.]
MIGVGVIGYGYWGPNLVRNFAQVNGGAVVAVCDANEKRLEVVEKLYPAVATYRTVDEMLADPAVDAVAIATPVSSHFPLAEAALLAGKHVFVEKPFTRTSAEGERLIELATDAGLTLMVDHTFIYTSAVRKIHELITTGQLGQLHYYDSVRVNLGLFQSDVSVMWDLAVHDLSIMDFLLGIDPITVAATGVAHVAGQPENMAYITCMFPDNLIAHFHVNWLAPVKVRQTLVCGSEKMVVFDDVDMSEKVKVYDKGVILDEDPREVYQKHVGYRTGDMWAPRLDNVEALALETQHFVDCIVDGTTPDSDGHAGLRVVRILEAAQESMTHNGLPVEVPKMRTVAR